MVGGKQLDQFARVGVLPAHKNPLPGHEHILEDDHRLVPAKPVIADIDLTPLQLAGVAGLPAEYVQDPLCIRWHCARHAVDPVCLLQAAGGHHQDFMRIDRPGLVNLGAPDGDTVLVFRHHPHEQVGVGLFRRGELAVALRVCHRSIDDQVIPLHVGKVLPETLVVVSPQILVHMVGDYIQRVEAVHPHAALEAAGRASPQQALHLNFFNQVVCPLVQVGEAVHPLAGQVRLGRHQVLVFKLIRQFVRHRNRVQRGPDHGMVDSFLDFLTEHKNPFLHTPQAIEIVLSGLDHGFILFYLICNNPRLCSVARLWAT